MDGLAHTQTPTSEPMFRIGQVCEQLQEEFPEVTITKLRFLQDKGIVKPSRTPSGYRMYSKEDIRALRIALSMQRDEFLPLKIIQQELQKRLAETSNNTVVVQGLSSKASGKKRILRITRKLQRATIKPEAIKPWNIC